MGQIRIAWRNLGRNRRRSLITGTALAIGTALCVATYGYVDGINAEILHALTRLDLGHLQIHEREYPRQRTLKHTIPDSERVLAEVRAVAGVHASARVYGFGLASHDSSSSGVQLCGVDPVAEPTVTRLDTLISAGRALDRAPTPWPEGRKLSADELARDREVTRQAAAEVMAELDRLGSAGAASGAPAAEARPRRESGWTRQVVGEVDPPPARAPRVVIGASLARALKARPGERIYLTAQTLDGLSAEGEFEVVGVFRTGTEAYDRGRVLLHLADLRRFLHLGVGAAHELAIRALSPEATAAIASRLRTALAGRPLLVRTWYELRPEIQGMLRLNRAGSALMVAFIFLVAAIGVVNTMLMAVLERTRELGMLKAIGMSGARILALILLETSLLVLVAASAGAAIGLGLDLYMIHHGIDLRSFTDGFSIGGVGLSPVLRAQITVEGVLVPIAILTAMSFLGALYPAARAARMRPAQGMREV